VTRIELESVVRRLLGAIAPEADLSALKPEVPFRDQLDMDSMDLLNFFVAIEKELGVSVPEADYAKVSTLGGCVDYLAAALG